MRPGESEMILDHTICKQPDEYKDLIVAMSNVLHLYRTQQAIPTKESLFEDFIKMENIIISNLTQNNSDVESVCTAKANLTFSEIKMKLNGFYHY